MACNGMVFVHGMCTYLQIITRKAPVIGIS